MTKKDLIAALEPFGDSQYISISMRDLRQGGQLQNALLFIQGVESEELPVVVGNIMAFAGKARRVSILCDAQNKEMHIEECDGWEHVAEDHRTWE